MEQKTKMSDLISRQAAIDALSLGKEILSRVLDDIDVVGTDRERYSWGLGLIESNIKDIEELPSAQPVPQNDSDRIYAMMKDYYFEHKDEHDVSWQGGFGKCMNLIPNVIEKKARTAVDSC